MAIFSLVAKRFEDGGWSGASRFDLMLRRVFPDLVSITPECIPDRFEEGDRVIADNHLALLVPESVNAIVVHHGCAATHYERDPQWRTAAAKRMVELQAMIPQKRRLRTLFWSPSGWAADEFSRHNPDWMRMQIVYPHWVERVHLPLPEDLRKIVIIGDWRDWNKGSEAWKKIAAAAPAGWEFKPLRFRTPEEKMPQYSQASAYLCLSVSEGGSYSMCDAEAMGLPIATTDVGNYREFGDSSVISWRDRDNPERVIPALKEAIAMGRRKTTWYDSCAFEDWARAWREAAA